MVTNVTVSSGHTLIDITFLEWQNTDYFHKRATIWEQNHYHRKVQLFHKMVNYFGKGLKKGLFIVKKDTISFNSNVKVIKGQVVGSENPKCYLSFFKQATTGGKFL